MKIWARRSPEIAALFNPAFCGLLLRAAVEGFVSQDREGMPFEQTFLVLPLVLHRQTRDILPTSIRTPFHTWVASNPTLRIGLPERIRASTPITRESLMFLLARQCVGVNGGLITLGSQKVRTVVSRMSDPDGIGSSIKSSGLIGRLLARAGSSATILANLGVTL